MTKPRTPDQKQARAEIRVREQARAEEAKRNGSYGDNEYAGKGVILCANCAQPLRDHKTIGPCPNPPTDNETRQELINKARYGRRILRGEGV